MTILRLSATAALLYLASTTAYSQSIDSNNDGSHTFQAGVDGVKIDFDNSQHVRRIYSKVSHPVTIADKRGIKTATIIAEEKAKANIVRYLQQNVTTGRAVTEVDATLSKTVQEKNKTGDSISTTDQRNIVQNLTEFTGSFSSGTIRGVIILEQGFDPNEQEVWVVAGVSDKTIAAAKAAGDMMAAPEPAPAKEGVSHGSEKSMPAQIKRNDTDF